MRHLKFDVNCGKKYCNPKPGKQCQFLSTRQVPNTLGVNDYWYCTLFHQVLEEKEELNEGIGSGRAIRCSRCYDGVWAWEKQK